MALHDSVDGQIALTVVVSTYNRPDALEMVLGALARQSDRNFEIVIAEDGSGQATEKVVADFAGVFGKRLRHVRQADQGFRLAAIRNRAVEATSADYVVFLDGDCVPSTKFIQHHRELAELGCFVTGNRILLDQSLTLKTLDGRDLPDKWSILRWAKERASGRINRLLPIALASLWLERHHRSLDLRSVRGCNLAVWRADLLASGGFDETFESWGGEDVDLAVRLFNAGVSPKSAHFAVNVFHLWHPKHGEMSDRNRKLIEESQATGRTRVSAGIGDRWSRN